MRNILALFLLFIILVDYSLAESINDAYVSGDKKIELENAIEDFSKQYNIQIKINTILVDSIDKNNIDKHAKQLFYINKLHETGTPVANIQILFAKTQNIGQYYLTRYRLSDCLIPKKDLDKIFEDDFNKASDTLGKVLFGRNIEEILQKYNEFLGLWFIYYTSDIRKAYIENQDKLSSSCLLDNTRIQLDNFFNKIGENINQLFGTISVIKKEEKAILLKERKFSDLVDYLYLTYVENGEIVSKFYTKTDLLKLEAIELDGYLVSLFIVGDDDLSVNIEGKKTNKVLVIKDKSIFDRLGYSLSVRSDVGVVFIYSEDLQIPNAEEFIKALIAKEDVQSKDLDPSLLRYNRVLGVFTIKRVIKKFT